ncbi:DUF4232 domain-containing protein [Streptomyces sp. MP131-18]|uniref:DUF4232 domain-containing protein n=1 Tax=Streptomyces sp. MP131-18 TaxID=1857892 RepID=UPI00097BBFA3|nr:DUF4232 domain-containing protein [Streptomyces sp. MP131-18]ONK12381.1 hypothetical protein STBA_31230 [Streptomyces sp. MP131-18]
MRTPRAHRRAPLLVLAAAGLLAAAGCGTGTAAPAAAPAAEPAMVPPSAAPEQAPGCADSGVRVTAGLVEAAMGLRVLSIELTNCGTEPYAVHGYPQLTLLDARLRPLDAEVAEGSADIAVVEGFDDAPEPFTLRPGERATAGLLWRNTVLGGQGAPVVAEHIRAAPAPGEEGQVLTPDGGIDLGTTGEAGVQAWRPLPR